MTSKMPSPTEPLFGWMMGAVGDDGASDATLYHNMMSDADLGYALGYDAPWLVEHHFGNYYPTPNPLQILSHIAAKYPDFGLGTAVIVTPWYHPLRVAEEISVLSHLSKGPLRIGFGRGSAPTEFEAFGLDMFKSKEMFEESLDIVRLALKGEAFTYEGTHFKILQPTRVRPTPRLDDVSFFGAIGQPTSAKKIADYGLQPLQTGQRPKEEQKEVLNNWEDAMRANGGNPDGIKVVSPILVMAETDEEAMALARKQVPKWFQLQVEHYKFDAERYANVPNYAPFNDNMKNRLKRTDPDNLTQLFEDSLIGGAETVARRVQQFLDIGYNYVMVQPSLPGLPHALRQDWLTRFGRDVMPRFGAKPRRVADPVAAAAQ